jgi:acyl dehydratase
LFQGNPQPGPFQYDRLRFVRPVLISDTIQVMAGIKRRERRTE